VCARRNFFGFVDPGKKSKKYCNWIQINLAWTEISLFNWSSKTLYIPNSTLSFFPFLFRWSLVIFPPSSESICYRQGLMVRAFLFYWSNEHSFKFSRMSFLAGVVRASERGEKNNRWGVILQERTTGVLRKYFTEWSFDHKLTERDFPLPQNHLSRKWGFCYLPDRMDGAKFFSLLYQSKKGH